MLSWRELQAVADWRELARRVKYDPNEPRDELGRWTDGGGSESGAAPAIDVAKVEAKTKENVAQASAKAIAAGAKPLEGSQGTHPATIGSAQATAVGSKLAYGKPDLAAMKADKNYAYHVDLFKDRNFYPNFRRGDLKGTTDEKARTIINHLKDNLKFLYQFADKHSGVWYDGARALVDDRAKLFGFNDASIAGVYAALSLTKDWDQNVHLGDMLMHIYKTQQDHRWDPKMDARAGDLWSEDNQPIVDLVRGKTLGELTDPEEKAVWIRTYDQTYNKPDYHVVLPDGRLGPLARNKDGSPSKVIWQTLPSITNAITALEANGDVAKISAAMGTAHKVRSFYNNILDPHSANGDSTIDTHAVGAALLRNLSNKTPAVVQNFGSSLSKKDQPPGYKGSRSSIKTGLSGTYPLYHQAYAEAAKELGIEPRQLQSIAWVIKREAFGNLTDAEAKAVEQEWQAYNKGDKSVEAVRQAIADIAKLVKHERRWRDQADEEGGDSDHAGALHRRGVWQGSSGVDRGARAAPAARAAGLVVVRAEGWRAGLEALKRQRRWQQLKAESAWLLCGFDPDEPRDEQGRWTEGGGSGGA